MSSLESKYEQFCDFMQHNTKGVEIGIYTISGALFVFSYLKHRPITKFRKSSDIPKHFITKRLLQNGTIKAIEPNQQTGALLRIDHKPPINLFFTSQKTLPVKIYGIDVNGNGYSWLQSVTLNQNVQFIPINNNHTDYAECQVKLLQDPDLNAKPNIDLAESLLSLGFAKASNLPKKIPSKNTPLQKYIRTLQKAQSKASKRPLPWPLNSIQNQIIRLIYDKVLPPKYRLPELVR